MKIARYLAPGSDEPKIGLVNNGSIAQLDDAPDAITVMNNPEQYSAAAETAPTVATGDVTLLAPYDPRVIWGVGLNYQSHADEVGMIVPPGPHFFIKPISTVAPPVGAIRRPANVKKLDFEAELGLVIGAGGDVDGLVVVNDVSARDFLEERQFTRMKGCDGFCPFGPWITTMDEIPDPYDLSIKTWVDGELRQDANTSDMLFRFDRVLSDLAESTKARSGDLITTGTPAGVGLAASPPRFLDDGQTVRIEIGHVGTIEHTVETVGA